MSLVKRFLDEVKEGNQYEWRKKKLKKGQTKVEVWENLREVASVFDPGFPWKQEGPTVEEVVEAEECGGGCQ